MAKDILGGVGNFFGDIWEKIKEIFIPKPKDPNPPKEENPSPWQENQNNKFEASNGAMNYIMSFAKPKTFDEWLTEQGLSRDVKNEKYFGNFYKKSAQTLVDQAYSNMQQEKLDSENRASLSSAISHNAYDRASSNFSRQNEQIFGKGLDKSGFSNYLKGLSYLAYRDELSDASDRKSLELTKAGNTFSQLEANAISDRDKDIAKREKELMDLYLQEINNNKGFISKLY